MKVIILTEGGEKTGFGHITRCLSIYQGFQERGIDSQIIFNGDPAVKSILQNVKYRRINWIRHSQSLPVLLNGASIVVVDSYLADIKIYKTISGLVPFPVFIDDNIRLNYPRSLIINGTVGSENFKYPAKNSVHYLLGNKITPLRREFWDVPSKTVNRKISNILITFGGSDICNLTGQVLLVTSQIFPKAKKWVIIGRSFSQLPNLAKWKDRSTHFIFNPPPAKLRDMMLNVDLAFSGGGQTLYELARVGLPAIAILVANNQRANIKGLIGSGFLEDYLEFRDLNLGTRLIASAKRMAPYETRKQIAKAGQRLIDGNGVRRIVRNIFSLLSSEGNSLLIRAAAKRDCRDLWIWRNDLNARKNCFDSHEIDFESHKKWFLARLKTNKSTIYIFESKALGKIGQVRFDRSSVSKASISIGLNPACIGKKLGTRLLVLATEAYLCKNRSVKDITAEVLKSNISSQKVFVRAGFLFSDKGFKNGKQFISYKFRRL